MLLKWMKYLLTLKKQHIKKQHIKKQHWAVVWTAYSRNQGRVISYYIGEGVRTATNLYLQVKNIIPNIAKICTDANSCYDIAFKRFGVKDLV